MNSNKLLADLQLKVKVQKIPKALWLCLNHTEKHKQDIIKIGAAWIDDNKFILNTEVFSNFINRQIHTVNRNLREHGFKTKKIGQVLRNHYFSILDIRLPFEQSWCLRNHNDFTRFSSEKTVDQIPYKPLQKKSVRRKIATTLQIPKNSSHYKGTNDLNTPKGINEQSNSNCPQVTNFFIGMEDFYEDNDDTFGPLFSDDQYFL